MIERSLVASVETNGVWYYTTNAGTTWTLVGTVNASSALLLADNANTRLYFAPAANYNGTSLSALTIRAWDQTSSGTPGTKISINITGGTSSFSSATDVVNVVVTPVNDAPVLTDTALSMTVAEDAGVPFGAVGSPVSAFTGGVIDVDNSVIQGVALMGSVQTNGVWYYTINAGTTWTLVGLVNASSALLLAGNPSTRLYFSPAANYNGTSLSALTIRAWHQTSGTPGTRESISTTGGTSAYSNATDTVDVVVTPVNDAPAIADRTLIITIAEDSGVPSGVVGSAISAFTGGITDVDIGAMKGIALVASVETNGVWYYTTNAGTTWTVVGLLNASSALLLADNASTRLYFAPTANYDATSFSALTVRAWDQTSGTAGSKVLINSTGGTSAFSNATDVVDVIVTPVNDAPALADTVLSMTVAEDAGVPSGAIGSPVSAFTGGVSDVDSGAIKGIALVGSVQTNGVWYFSTNSGSTWTVVGPVNDSSALLLADNASTRLYFAPAANYNGTSLAALTIRAWDQSSGAVGTKVAINSTGGTSAFSNATDVVDVIVTPVNDAPVLSDTVLSMAVAEDAGVPSGAIGSLVSMFTSGISDVDSAAVKGIAVVGSAETNGVWYYTTNAGATWALVGTVSASSALLLADNANTRLYFAPAANYSGTSLSALTIRAWDQTSGAEGIRVAISSSGGTSALSTATDVVDVLVTPANKAPVLSDTVLSMAVAEDAGVPSGVIGSPVSAFTGGISDVDSGAIKGIALVGSVQTNGVWYFSTNSGSTWTVVGPVNDSSALLLTDNANTRLYFAPAANYNGTSLSALTIRAWDQTSGTAGTKVLTSSTGGTSAFSNATDVVDVIVTPVNDAPALADTVLNITVAEDAGVPSGAVGSLISSFTSGVSEVDSSAIKGIAVVGSAETNGVWYYTTNAGATWTLVGTVSASSAFLLADNANTRLYFAPAANYNGTSLSALTIRAWDQTSGTVGSKVLIASTGGTSAFSNMTDVVDVIVTPVNDAPVLTATLLSIAIAEDAGVPLGAIGSLVSAFTVGITDVDGGAVKGLALVGSAESDGVWYYTTNAGTSGTIWTLVGPLNASSALLLADHPSTRLYFAPAANYNGTSLSALTIRAWDQTSGGTSGSKVLIGGLGGTSAFSTTMNSVNVIVTSVNDAPVLANTTLRMTVSEHSGVLSATDGLLVSAFTGGVSDVDRGASRGIALVGSVETNGVWYYSTNAGTTWSLVGTVSTSSALLLPDNASTRLYFASAVYYNGTSLSALTIRAWDQTSGAAGARVSTAFSGGNSAFSTATDTIDVVVTSVNHSPVLADTSLSLTVAEDAGMPSGAVGAPISAFTGGITDADVGDARGIALISSVQTNGTWYFTTNAGNTWTAVGIVNASSSLLLPDDVNTRLYFTPKLNYNGTSVSALTILAWDQVVGVARDKVDTSVNGGFTSFSSASDTVNVIVSAVNDAPELADTWLSITALEDAGIPYGAVGSPVSSFTGGISDDDTGALIGIAFVASNETNGTWYYTVNAGEVWSEVGPVNATSSLLLEQNADTLLYFAPAPNFSGQSSSALTIRAWDRTLGSGSAGTRTSTVSNGGVTAFSYATDVVDAIVTPVNDAPTLDAGFVVQLPDVRSNLISKPVAASSLLTAANWHDADVGDPSGIAIYGLVGEGTWQFSSDNGSTWAPIDNGLSLGPWNALLLSASTQLRYEPLITEIGVASFELVAWDRFTGSGTPSVSATNQLNFTQIWPSGGASAFSIETASVQMVITVPNEAPVLDNTGDMQLTDISDYDISNNGNTVASIIASAGGDRITDANVDDPEGIAIIIAGGLWEFKVNAGPWIPVGSVSATQSLLLKDTDRIRFVPNYLPVVPSFTFRAWDQSTNVAGTKVDVSINGGTTAFSTATETANIVVRSSKNNAPQFTSIPVLDVYAGVPYRYESMATDSEGDSLTFSKGTVIWPAGFNPRSDQEFAFQFLDQGIDQRGIYTWTPPAELAGKKVLLEEVVTDGFHAPVRRSIELAIAGQTGNSAPFITSQPPTNYQIPLTPTGFVNSDPVTPDYLSLHLADGQEVKVKVSIDPSHLGSPTADVVIALDLTGSMGDAVAWLSNGTVSVVEQIESKLVALGVTNNRYGLTVFYTPLQLTNSLEMSIAIGKVLVTSPPSCLHDVLFCGLSDEPENQEKHGIPLAESASDLWGSVEQLKLALQSISINPYDGSEHGHLALHRIFDVEPPDIERDGISNKQYSYSFRGNATTTVVLITDDEVTAGYNYDLQKAITDRLVGNLDTTTDDVVFTTVLMSDLMGNDRHGNDTPYVIHSDGWTIDDENITFRPNGIPGGRGFALFDTIPFVSKDFRVDLGLNNWSMNAAFQIQDLGATYDQRVRFVFGTDKSWRITDKTNKQMPNNYFYLEADAFTDSWRLMHSSGTAYPLSLHAGASWPDIKAGQLIEIEIRVVSSGYDSVQRLDLFLNGKPTASALMDMYSWFNNEFGTWYIGYELVNSSISIDKVQFWALPDDDKTFNLPPTAATPHDFSNPERQEVAKRIFVNDYGLVDGSSFDPNIIGVDFGGAAFLLTDSDDDQVPEFSRLENPDVSSTAYRISGHGFDEMFLRYEDTHYLDMVRAVNGSTWNLGLLRGTNGTPANMAAFSTAFSETLAREILSRAITVESDSVFVTHVEPAFDPENPLLATYEVTMKGNGGSEQSELRFVRHNGTSTTNLGTIPLWITSPYSHNFEASDYENDVPFVFAFDPDFLDENGVLITHGAQLVDSGRPGMSSDRLIWTPPLLNSPDPKDYQFRVIVYDSAGQIGRKDWTVTVYPQQPNNAPPAIDINGLTLDTNSNDGLLGEPLLPGASDLRGYRYQVKATDADARDQGNLRYYLVPTTLTNGRTKTPVPAWLTIDRNTGVITGRPGTADIGTTHVSVVVSDGRFRQNNDGSLVASQTVQAFAIVVRPRDHINTPPNVASIDDLAIRIGDNFNVQINAFDSDHDDLSFVLTSSPKGMVIDPKTGKLNWTPGPNTVDQLQSVVVTVSDGQTSTAEAFSILVGNRNRAPKITTELRDWGTYADYEQLLTASDEDGDVVWFNIAVGPANMTIKRNEAGKLVVSWARQDIILGRQFVRLRSFDNAGGVAERDYYINFKVLSSPLIVEVAQPVWREGRKDTAWIAVTSVHPMLNTSDFVLNANTQSKGMTIDHANIGVDVDNAGYFVYFVPIVWTPRYAGTYDAQVLISNDNGTTKRSLDFVVHSFVTQSENRAPAFGSRFVGPFEKDRGVYFPVDVSDSEGNAFTVTSTSHGGIVVDNMWNFAAPVAGAFPVSLRATENQDTRVMISTQSHPIAVFDDATGKGWIMYSSQNVQTRFGSGTSSIPTNASTNFLAVRRNAGAWEYNNDTLNWFAFAPRPDDLLIANLDFDANTVTSLIGKSGRISGVAFGYVSGNLTFQADDWLGTSDPGEFTVSGNQFVIATAKTSGATQSIFIVDNATPGISYFDPRQANLGSDYVLQFNALDPNPTDTIAIKVGKDAFEAGLILVKPISSDLPYKLIWSKESIATWSATHPLPTKLPISLQVTDNHGATSSVSLDLPVRDPSLVPSFPTSYSYRISANRTWNQTVDFENPGGHQLLFDVFAVNADDNIVPLPTGLSVSLNDGHLNWSPSAGLLYSAALSKSLISNTAIITTTKPHNFQIGDSVTVSIGDIVFDGTVTITDIGSTIVNGPINQFAYNKVHSDITPSAIGGSKNSIRADQVEFNFYVIVKSTTSGGNPIVPPIPMSVTVVDPSIFNPFIPIIDTSETPPLAGTVNETLVYQPVLKPFAPEHVNETVVWSLETAPQGMTIDSSTGRISWLPTQKQLGLNAPVVLRASSSQAAGTTMKFSLGVRGANSAPMFNSTFPTVWETGTPFEFNPTGSDPEGHQLSYELIPTNGALPSGLSVNKYTGIIKWQTPTAGLYDFFVRVYERFNPSSKQEQRLALRVFDPNVLGSRTNLEPRIVGNPQGTIISAGSDFQFAFGIVDPDQPTGVGFTYTLVESPPATIDSTGKFRWTPSMGTTGLKAFRLAVTDQSPHAGVANNTRYLTFHLIAITNYSPEFKSPGSLQTYVGVQFVHHVKATDPDKDAILFRLEGTIPDGMQIDPATGEIRWLVPDATQNYSKSVIVVATDARGGTTKQTLTINVSTEDKVPPTLTFYLKDSDGNTIAPNSELLAENFHDYDLWIDIQDNRGLSLPNGNQNGSWYLSAANTAANTVEEGIKAATYFSGGSTGALKHGLWKVDLVGSGLNQGLLEFNLEAYDQAGNIVKRYARYYVNDPTSSSTGKILNINEKSAPITDRFEVMGNALFSNQGGTGTYDLKLTSMNDPSDFLYIARNQPALISDSVIGIIDGTIIPTGQYRLNLEIHCSVSCIQAVDERIIEVQNVTRLGNLDLAFSDLNVALGGVPVPLVRTYSSGLVGESDASGNGGFSSDFGPGWNLNILQSGISISHPKGTTTSLDQAFAKGTRVFVTLPSGQVHRFTFAPVPVGNDLFIPRLSPDPEFKSELYLKDVDQNVRLVLNQARNDGTYLIANDKVESVPANFGSEWILKTQDGLEYHFDLTTGSLLSIQSASGARLDIEENPTNHYISISTRNTGDNNDDGNSTIKKVVIIRELKPGSTIDKPQYRVISIADAIVESSLPGQDRQVHYRYGKFVPTNGSIQSTTQNLAQVELIDGQKTSYGYNNSVLSSHLTNIYDNASKHIFTATYFADINNDGTITSVDRDDERFGRLSTTSNANGSPTNFGFDFDLGNGNKVRSTNTSGVTVEQVLNMRGNAVRVVTLVTDHTDETKKLYLATVTRYNLRGLVTAQSKPFYITGAANRFTMEPAEPTADRLAWSSINTYDTQDRKLTVSDAAGGVTSYTYDDANGLQTTTDPFGVTSVRHIDPTNGQLLETYTSRSDSPKRLDHVTYNYDAYGNVTHQWLNLDGGTKVLTSQSFYNQDGFLAWSEQLGSPRQYFAYDGNGQQTHSWQNIPSAKVTGQYTTIVNFQFNGYAGEANPFSSNDSGNGGLQSAQFEIVGTTVYDETNIPLLLLKLAAFETTNSGVTKTSESNSIKNARDQVVETRSLSLDSDGNRYWFISRTTYDIDGRAVYQTGSYRTDTPVSEITGTHNLYDGEGRVWKTEQVKGLDISVTSSQIGIGESNLVNPGSITVQSYTTTLFGALGRTISSTQFSNSDSSSGLTSSSTTNPKGQVTETRQEAWNGAGTGKVTFITRTVYDSRDRVILQTDSYLEGSSTVFANRTLYDSADRAYGSVRVQGIFVNIDVLGQTTIDSARPGIVQYATASYYNLNRLVRSEDQFGNSSESEYDPFGRQVASIGPRVVIDSVPVRHRTETVYDDRGRVVSQRSGIIQDESGKGKHDYSQLRITSYTFDVVGRVIRTTFSDNSFAQVRYDALGRKIAESKQVAAGTQLVWSAAQNSFRDQTTNELVPTRTTEYDSQGRMRAVELPAVEDPKSSAYNPDPNPVPPNSLFQPRYQYGYSASGQQSLIVDPYGFETRISFDSLGRQVSRALPLEFGADGKKGTSDDAAPDSFSEFTRYDSRGRQSLAISFEGVHTQYVYNDVTGRLLEVRTFANAANYANGTGTPQDVSKNTYDDYGRVIKVDHFVGVSVVPDRIEITTFDAEGRVFTTSNPEGNIRYSYDKFGRMTSKEWTSRAYPFVAGNAYENLTNYNYDELGRLKSVTQVNRGGVTLGPQDTTLYKYNLIGGLDRTIYQNGLIHENDYDVLNRLDKLTHWVDKNGNSKLDAGELRAEFDYTVRPDGKRTSVAEKVWDETGNKVSDSSFTWEYDAVDRLISETAGGWIISGYEMDWVYDMAGNRLKQTKQSGVVTEETTYQSDANDRLLQSSRSGGAQPETISYNYDRTQQTGKITTTVFSNTTTQTFAYNLHGMMSTVSTQKSDGSDLTKTVYRYDSTGTRISSSQYVASSQEPTAYSLQTSTEYLTDSQNPTGYSQVLQETTYSPLPPEEGPGVRATKKVIYTIGHDQISQTTVTIDSSGLQSPASSLYFGTDGHGSVRVLYDMAAAIVRDQAPLEQQQLYSFDAYGNLLGWTGAQPLTSYLYSGESFDFNIGQQYLRARFYDATTGSFNRLDPFFGNSSDPQSFHKYAYVHGDPVQGVDPTGMFWQQLYLQAQSAAASLTALRYAGAIIKSFGFIRSLQLFAALNIATRSLLKTESRSRSIGDVNRVAELAELATASYKDYKLPTALGGRWVEVEIPSSITNSAGFKAKAWKNNQRIVVGFAGTDDIPDVAVDLFNGISIPSGQYRSAFKVADWAIQTFGSNNVEFTGHSLGGGLSAVASYRTGRPSTTFNAAGISAAGYALNAISTGRSPAPNEPSIKNYYVPGDPLSGFQDFSLAVNASGTHIALPNTSLLASYDVFGHFLDQHKMGAVRFGIDEWRREVQSL